MEGLLVNKPGSVLVFVIDWSHQSCQQKVRQTFNMRRTLGGNKIVDHSDVVGASPAGAAPTTFSFLT